MADIEGVNIVIGSDSSAAVQEINKLVDALNKLQKASSNFNLDLNIRANSDTVFRNVQKQAATAGEKAGKTFWTKFKEQGSALAEAMDKVNEKFESGFGSIVAGIGAKIIALGGSLSLITKMALSIGGGFESQMTTVKVISGATADELDALTKKAREMGATLPISAKDAATAMTFLAQRGTSAKDILKSVTDVANLAISQGVDMGSAAELLGSTMTNFGISIDDAAKVTNIFNNVSNQSAMDMSKLAEALKYVGPAAGSVGMQLTEAASAMEVLANSGLTGEMVGTGLAMVISKLASSAQVLGVRTKNLDGTMRPLKDIFSELQKKGFSLAEATAIFGQRGNKAALALAKYSATLEENEQRLQNWGATQSAVDEKSKTFSNTMQALHSAVEELHIEIFEQIKTQAKDAVSGVSELVRVFSAWVQETKIAEKSINAFLEGLGVNIPSGDDFKKLLDSFDTQIFVDKVKSFGSSLNEIGSALANLHDVIEAPLNFLIEHLETFGNLAFWGWIADKALHIPAAIIGLAGAFIQLYQAFKAFEALKLTSLISLIANPIGLVALVAGVAVFKHISAVMEDEANAQAIRLEEAQKKLQQEIDKADKFAAYEFDIKVKTGFEALPDSYKSASDNVKKSLDDDLAFMKDLFKQRIYQAWQEVNPMFSSISDKFVGSLNDISDDDATLITKALQGDLKSFEQMSAPLQKVTEKLYDMGIRAGEAKGNFETLIAYVHEFGTSTKESSDKAAKLAQSLEELKVFSDSVNGAVHSTLEDLSANISRSQSFLDSKNGQLSISVSLEQAKKQLITFSKSTAETFGLPDEIVKASIFNQLKDLAAKGNQSAQSLANAWDNASYSIDTFLQNAQDAINYLGASPDSFLPALNKMYSGIQKFDPLTGKLTEQFKKAHDALKQWSNVTFDKLAKRIQSLRKAYEGGFIDQKSLEAEFKRVAPQLKLQIVNELQSSKGQFRNEQDYQSVIASEFSSKVHELFGDIGDSLLRNVFNEQTGSSMGRAILHEVQKDVTGNNNIVMKIDGIDMLKQSAAALNTQFFSQSIASTMNPVISKFEQLSSHSQAEKDYSNSIAQVVQAIQNVSTGVRDVKGAVVSLESAVKSQSSSSNTNNTNIAQALSNSISPLMSKVDEVKNAVLSVDNSVKSSSQSGYSNFDSSSISQALTNGFNPLLYRLEQNSANLINLQQSITELKISADNNTTALSQQQSGNNDFSTVLSPILNAIQDVHTSLTALEAALKSVKQGNTFNIDIEMQGFNVQKNSDADILARSLVSSLQNSLRSGFGNGGV